MRRIKQFLSATVTASMVLGSFQPASIVFAAANDIQGHWAETVISTWQDNNLISGYEDGSFRPNQAITRAEFVRLMNQSLQLTEQGSVNFSDVTSSDWFYNDVAIAMGEGYCSGFPDGTFHPQESVTRAQAATFVSNAKGLSANAAGASSVTDELPSWAAGSVGAMLEAGYMSGYPDGSFNANGVLTRAEAVSTLDRVMGNLPATESTDEEDEGKEKVDGLTIDKSGQTIKDQVIDGDLLISEKVGSGEVTLEGVTINGDLIVEGGGSNSIYLRDCKVKGTLKMAKKGARVVLGGKTEVEKVDATQAGHLDQEKGYDGAIKIISISVDLGKSTAFKINVKTDSLLVKGVANIICMANVGNVVVDKGAEGARLEVASGAKVDTMEVNVKMSILGDGKITTLEANVSGITKASSITVEKTKTPSGVDKPTINTGGGGGGGNNNTVTKKVPVGVNLTATPVQKGTKLANSQLSGKFQVSSTDNTIVEGTLAWSKGDTIVTETGLHPWIFTPKDTNTYATVVGNIEVVAQDEPVQKAPVAEAVSATEVTKGAKLSTSTLSGSFVDADTKEAVSGKLDWTSPETIVDETKDYEWKFTPDNAVAYRAITGMVEVKAIDGGDQPDPVLKTPVLEGAVSAEPVEKDAKLSTSKLTGKFVDPEDKAVEVKGTLKWDSPDEIVSAEKEYAWTFTPEDTTTYNKVPGNTKVTLKTVTPPVTPVDPYKASVSASAVNVGDTLVKSTLKGTFTVTQGDNTEVKGTLKWDDETTVVSKTENYPWTFTPDDTALYNEVKGTVKVVANDPTKITPEPIAPVTATGLKEGDRLGQSSLIGTFKDPVSGTALTGDLVWDNPDQIVTASADYAWTFTVTNPDPDGFNPATGTARVEVTPVQKTITMAGTITASKVQKGAKLSDSTLDISKATFTGPNGESVNGKIAWKNPDYIMSKTETNMVWVYTPTNTTSYKPLEGTVQVVVEDSTKETPVSDNVTATEITVGQKLSDSQLSGDFYVGTTKVDGTLKWADGTIEPKEGSDVAYAWIFTPKDASTYNEANGTVKVVVKAKTPSGKLQPESKNISVEAVTSGDTLSSSNLKGDFYVNNEATKVTGTLGWVGGGDTVLTQSGKHKWQFTPDNLDLYEVVTGDIDVTVNTTPPVKVTPVEDQAVAVTFNGVLTSGQTEVTLSGSHLSGSFKVSASNGTSVDGTLYYVVNGTQVEEVILTVGKGEGEQLTHSVIVRFVPTKGDLYDTPKDKTLSITFRRESSNP